MQQKQCDFNALLESTYIRKKEKCKISDLIQIANIRHTKRDIIDVTDGKRKNKKILLLFIVINWTT